MTSVFGATRRFARATLRLEIRPPSGRAPMLCVVALIVSSAAVPAAAQTPAEAEAAIAALVTRSRVLAGEGDVGAASALAEKALTEARSRLGDGHPYVAFIADDLANYAVRLGDASAALRHSDLVARVIEAGSDAMASYADPLRFNRASLLAAIGRYHDAVPLFEASLAARAASGDADGELAAMKALGIGYLELQRFERAQVLFERYRDAIRSRTPIDAERELEANLLLSKAWLFADEPARAAEALPAANEPGLAERSPERRSELAVMRARLALHRSDLGAASDSLDRAAAVWEGVSETSATALGTIDFNRARIALLRGDPLLVETNLKSALARYTENTVAWTPAALRALHGLALANRNLGRFDEADRLLERVIETRSTLFGPEHRSVAQAIGERVLVLVDQGRHAEAIEAAETAERLLRGEAEEATFQRGLVHNGLGFAYKGAGEDARALESFRRGAELLAQARGPDSADLPPGLIASAELLLAAGDTEAAGEVIERAERIVTNIGSRTADRLGEVLSRKAELAVLEGRCDAAHESVAQAFDILLDYRARARAGASAAKIASDRDLIDRLVESAVRCVRPETGEPALHPLVFRGLQLSQLRSTAGAISRMAQRVESDDPALAALLRARGNLAESIATRDREVESVWIDGEENPAERHRALIDAITRLDDELDAVDDRIAREFPAFARYVSPSAVSVEAVRASLEPGEAVVVQLTGERGTHLAFVSPDVVRFAETALTAEALTNAVASLRRGLVASDFRARNDFPALDLAAAYGLYAALVEPFAADLAGVEHLLFVPDRALQRLPLALLLSEPVPEAPGTLRGHRRLPWLIKRFALSTLPSVDALVSLRSVPSASGAGRDGRAFAGFGDPLFPAPDADAWTGRTTRGAALARTDVRSLRASLERLEETADELEEIAAEFPDGRSRLFLRDQATESNVKQTDLAPFSVLAFATHGLLADDLAHAREPSLVLTIPDEPTELDDGILTASEVARLKLDADWVVLSACNTASDVPGIGADGLSGLARAFFHAGARSLLVSHWEVDSRAAQLITTRAIRAHESGDVRGKAEALRASMLHMLAGESGGNLAHPVYWAPFVQVGDGR